MVPPNFGELFNQLSKLDLTVLGAYIFILAVALWAYAYWSKKVLSEARELTVLREQINDRLLLEEVSKGDLVGDTSIKFGRLYNRADNRRRVHLYLDAHQTYNLLDRLQRVVTAAIVIIVLSTVLFLIALVLFPGGTPIRLILSGIPLFLTGAIAKFLQARINWIRDNLGSVCRAGHRSDDSAVPTKADLAK